jgi:hypothetical protein
LLRRFGLEAENARRRLTASLLHQLELFGTLGATDAADTANGIGVSHEANDSDE